MWLFRGPGFVYPSLLCCRVPAGQLGDRVFGSVRLYEAELPIPFASPLPRGDDKVAHFPRVTMQRDLKMAPAVWGETGSEGRQPLSYRFGNEPQVRLLQRRLGPLQTDVADVPGLDDSLEMSKIDRTTGRPAVRWGSAVRPVIGCTGTGFF